MKEIAEIRTSFENATPDQKVFYIGMGIVMPIIGFGVLAVGGPELGANGVICCLSFAIAGIWSIGSTLLCPEIVTITEKGLRYRNFTTKKKMNYSQIAKAIYINIDERIGLERTKDRELLFIRGKQKNVAIALGDMFSKEDKRYLYEILEYYQEYYGYELLVTNDPMAAFDDKNHPTAKKLQRQRWDKR